MPSGQDYTAFKSFCFCLHNQNCETRDLDWLTFSRHNRLRFICTKSELRILALKLRIHITKSVRNRKYSL